MWRERIKRTNEKEKGVEEKMKELYKASYIVGSLVSRETKGDREYMEFPGRIGRISDSEILRKKDKRRTRGEDGRNPSSI